MTDAPAGSSGTTATSPILLGTVAIEPTRWARLMPGSDAAALPPPIVLADWLDAIRDAGFDGVEVWERHLLDASPADGERVRRHHLPIVVWNSYASLDEDDPTERRRVADAATEAGATGIKFNVGNDIESLERYADRIAAWLDDLPDSVRLLCECHHGISIAERPDVAARIFDRAGPASRVQAIVHTHESDDELRARFDAYGDRITHVHVNFLDFATMSAPPLCEVADRLAATADLLSSSGFDGSWTLEFCHGLLTDDDHPEFLLQQAESDLAVLRDIVGGGTP